MAVREGMQQLIDRTRSLANCNTDELFNGVTYWTDEQLQDVLDNYASEWSESLLKGRSVYTFPLYMGYGLETTTIEIENSSGVIDPLDYTVNLAQRTVVFTDEQTTDVTIYATRYDVYEAVAQVWEVKSSQRSDFVNFRAGNHKVDMAQDYQHCVERARYYRSKKVRGFKR